MIDEFVANTGYNRESLLIKTQRLQSKLISLAILILGLLSYL